MVCPRSGRCPFVKKNKYLQNITKNTKYASSPLFTPDQLRSEVKGDGHILEKFL